MKFRWGSKLLHLKLVLLFTLFGLIVGYFSFLSGTFSSGVKILDEYRKGIEGLFEDGLNDRDLLYDAFIRHPHKGEELRIKLQQFGPENGKENIQFCIYMKNFKSKQWHILTTVTQDLSASFTIDEKKVISLEKTLESGFTVDHNPLIGREKNNSIFIDISGEEDRNRYIIQLGFQQDGIITYIKDNSTILVSYGSIVLLLSFLLGSLFASWLSGPIREMTDSALQMAAGNLDIKKKACRRWDDLGHLSRSMETMANNISHRIDTMRTMNKIDRAVLSPISRKELLYKVSEYISEQFDHAKVLILEKIEVGYQIRASIPTIDELNERIIANADITEKLLKSPEVPFEFKHWSDLINITIPTAEIKKKKNYSIPLFQDEKFIGVFLISLDSLSEQDKEALKMLADQAGVALKSLHDMTQKEKLYQALFLSLTRSVDAKSRWTAGHSDRVAELADMLTSQMDLEKKLKEDIHMGALLHDIGKMGVPEAILDKPGKLSKEEFHIIQSHPAKGDEILMDVPDFDVIRNITRSHHEKWDGTGYPDGLAGKEIPLPARIVTIADVFDAITENRPYRKGFTIEETYKFLREQRGRLFDPELLDIFLEVVLNQT